MSGKLRYKIYETFTFLKPVSPKMALSGRKKNYIIKVRAKVFIVHEFAKVDLKTHKKGLLYWKLVCVDKHSLNPLKRSNFSDGKLLF